MADEVADSGERKVALESARQLEDLAQVEQSPRAAVPLGAQLGPAQVAAFLEQAIQDVRDGERVAEPAQPVSELDQAHSLARDLLLHLRKAFARRFVKAISQPHARAALAS